jgi:hypothetical protein
MCSSFSDFHYAGKHFSLFVESMETFIFSEHILETISVDKKTHI